MKIDCEWRFEDDEDLESLDLYWYSEAKLNLLLLSVSDELRTSLSFPKLFLLITPFLVRLELRSIGAGSLTTTAFVFPISYLLIRLLILSLILLILSSLSNIFSLLFSCLSFSTCSTGPDLFRISSILSLLILLLICLAISR